jgi:hypothetical protein
MTMAIDKAPFSQKAKTEQQLKVDTGYAATAAFA